MLDCDQNDEKNDKKSMFTATNFDYCVCNGTEITATYFLVSTKAFQNAFWQENMCAFATPTP